MIKTIKYWIFISVLLACTLFLCFKQLKHKNWNRCISSDGKGYYAYLPAIFIYNDLQFQFVDEYESKYYQPENKVNFINKLNDKNINKYWMGTSLLMSPFFFTAHLFAKVLSLPADGYSFIYQMMIAVAACFYLLLGLFFMRKTLLLYKFNEMHIFISLFAIVFATNLFYYTVAEPSLSHVYSMAAISSFIYFSKKYFETFMRKYLTISTLIFALIILIRPTNALVLFSIPFLAGSKSNLKNVFSQLKTTTLFTLLISVLAVISLQLFYYKMIAGSYFINSYGDEHFNFLKPHFFDFLFSYRRGLFVYAPVLLISLFGFNSFLKKSLFQGVLLILFLLTLVYILSSWWMWYYGGGFGMRPMIDYFVFFAILLASFIQSCAQKKVLKYISLITVASCVILAQIQTYQKVNFILPWDGINKAIYWNLFLKTDSSYIGKFTSENHAQ